MSDDNEPEPEDKDIPPVDKDEPKPKDKDEPKPKDKDQPSEEFKELKSKLDKLYGERDTLKDELAEAKKSIRDAELERLKNEGKEVEALQAQLDDAKLENEQLKKTIVELTRDNAVIKELGNYELRNDRANDLAYTAILKELVQDDKGNWVHKGGKSISEFIKSYFEDEENEFLLKPKENRGTGSDDEQEQQQPTDKTSKHKKGSLFGKSQAEVLRMAEEGKLPSRK